MDNMLHVTPALNPVQNRRSQTADLRMLWVTPTSLGSISEQQQPARTSPTKKDKEEDDDDNPLGIHSQQKTSSDEIPI